MKRTALLLGSTLILNLELMAFAAEARQQTRTSPINPTTGTTGPTVPGPTGGAAAVAPGGPGGNGGCIPRPSLPGQPSEPCGPAIKGTTVCVPTSPSCTATPGDRDPAAPSVGNPTRRPGVPPPPPR